MFGKAFCPGREGGSTAQEVTGRCTARTCYWRRRAMHRCLIIATVRVHCLVLAGDPRLRLQPQTCRCYVTGHVGATTLTHSSTPPSLPNSILLPGHRAALGRLLGVLVHLRTHVPPRGREDFKGSKRPLVLQQKWRTQGSRCTQRQRRRTPTEPHVRQFAPYLVAIVRQHALVPSRRRPLPRDGRPARGKARGNRSQRSAACGRTLLAMRDCTYRVLGDDVTSGLRKCSALL